MKKYVSKYSNCRIVLTPGIPGNSVLGNPPRPTVYVKFEDGFASVFDDKLIEMLEKTQAFLSGDVVEVQDIKNDPYKDTRKPMEPEHSISEMVHGSAVEMNPAKKPMFTPEQKKFMREFIEEGIKEGLKEFTEKVSGSNEAQSEVVTDNKDVTKTDEVDAEKDILENNNKLKKEKKV